MNKRSQAVMEWRRRAKAKAVETKGGQCSICGYDKNYAALEFHHTDPFQKEFSFGLKGIPRSWDRMLKELEKCVLICSNCHGEHHEEEPTIKNNPVYELKGQCETHGYTDIKMVNRGRNRKPTATCVLCSRERVGKYRKDKKRMIVEALGGKCSVCSYSRSLMSLDAHHLFGKEHAVSRMTNKDKILDEIKKCVLLCRNCHKEEHYPHLER